MKNTHTFLVHVTGCSEEQAAQVAAERLNHDEDYGFPYVLQYEHVIGTPLFILTTADAQSSLRRPLVAGEERPLRKLLEVGLAEEWAGLLMEVPDPPTTDLGASGIVAGLHTIKEYGMDDWLTITEVDTHGDTVLLTGVDVDGGEHQFTLDRDEVVELLVTEP